MDNERNVFIQDKLNFMIILISTMLINCIDYFTIRDCYNFLSSLEVWENEIKLPSSIAHTNVILF